MGCLGRLSTRRWIYSVACLWTLYHQIQCVLAWNLPLPGVNGSHKRQVRSSNVPRMAHHNNLNQVPDRRSAMTTAAMALMTGILLDKPIPAWAYQKSFPVELDMVDADLKTPRQRAVEKEQQYKAKSLVTSSNPVNLGLGSLVWGGALWLLTGSRSNPLATPLANLLYSQDDEVWLQDRNDGLFAALPVPLLALLAVVFCLVGLGVHLLIISLAEGSVAISFQLAVVLLIGGATLELGRFASGEKKLTRDDFDRASMLEREFQEFAENRLKLGGYCHRSEVVQAFRRYYAKYRQADSAEYPLNDLEIERLLRDWNSRNAGAQRSAAGFYTGIQINADADVFVKR